MKRFTKSSSSGPQGTETYSQLYEEVGRRIRQHRARRGLTQQALADAISLTRPSIANIECGRQGLLVHTLFEIAVALKIDPHELLRPTLVVAARPLNRVVEEYEGPGRQWVRDSFGVRKSVS